MDNKYNTVCVFVILLTSVPVQGIDDDVSCALKTYGGMFLAGTVAVAATPVVLGSVGFTAGGITAGSLAAKAMAVSAAANGGGVVAGGAVATLQSVGAAGLGVAGNTVLASGAAMTYRYATGGCSNGDINCDCTKCDEKKTVNGNILL